MSGTPTGKHTILLVDDHPMMRRGLRQLLEMDAGLRVVGEANDGADALVQAAALAPELVVLDNKMAGMGGLETLRRLREQGFAGCVLMYTVSDAEDDVRDAMRLGANGYLLKDMEPRDLLANVHRALAGEVVMSEGLARHLRAAIGPSLTERLGLTTRELEVLRMLASGSSNRVIGERLGIAEGTVKVHVKNLFGKLGLHNRVEAVVWAMEKLGA